MHGQILSRLCLRLTIHKNILTRYCPQYSYTTPSCVHVHSRYLATNEFLIAADVVKDGFNYVLVCRSVSPIVNHFQTWYSFQTWYCFIKKVFLEILQNSQESNCARVSFFNKVAPFLTEHLWCLLLIFPVVCDYRGKSY